MLVRAQTIPLQPWMQTPEIRAVMAALGTGGQGSGEPQALTVGGCVRNTLLGLPVADIDIATRFTPEEVMNRLAAAGLRAVPTGLAHGTVTAVAGGRTFEITTLRQDVQTDGRHAVVAYTADWRTDAQRRDFTINTLLADIYGNIYDPLGSGLADLAARRVVFVGQPARRIAEDYLRILRFFRFYAHYGAGAPDAAALAACRAASAQVASLSRERVTHEVLRLLEAERAPAVLALMFGHDVLAGLAAAAPFDSAPLTRLIVRQQQFGLPDVMARLAALNPDTAALERFMVLSGDQKKRMTGLAVAAGADRQAVMEAVYRRGNDIVCQALLLHGAETGLKALVDLAAAWQAPEFPVTGDDVLAAGVAAGPAVGQALAKIEQWWITQGFTPTRAQCLSYLKNVIKA